MIIFFAIIENPRNNLQGGMKLLDIVEHFAPLLERHLNYECIHVLIGTLMCTNQQMKALIVLMTL